MLDWKCNPIRGTVFSHIKQKSEIVVWTNGSQVNHEDSHWLLLKGLKTILEINLRIAWRWVLLGKSSRLWPTWLYLRTSYLDNLRCLFQLFWEYPNLWIWVFRNLLLLVTSDYHKPGGKTGKKPQWWHSATGAIASHEAWASTRMVPWFWLYLDLPRDMYTPQNERKRKGSCLPTTNFQGQVVHLVGGTRWGVHPGKLITQLKMKITFRPPAFLGSKCWSSRLQQSMQIHSGDQRSAGWKIPPIWK